MTKTKSATEIFAIYPVDFRGVSIPSHYGPWRLNVDDMTLKHVEYEIDLTTIKDSAEMLDWIMQVAGKGWANSHVLGWLVLAFDAIFDPQACLCPGGTHKTINPREYLQERFS